MSSRQRSWKITDFIVKQINQRQLRLLDNEYWNYPKDVRNVLCTLLAGGSGRRGALDGLASAVSLGRPVPATMLPSRCGRGTSTAWPLEGLSKA